MDGCLRGDFCLNRATPAFQRPFPNHTGTLRLYGCSEHAAQLVIHSFRKLEIAGDPIANHLRAKYTAYLCIVNRARDVTRTLAMAEARR